MKRRTFVLTLAGGALAGSLDVREAGGLLSYGPVMVQHWPRLAAQIDRILRGAKPADLPVEQPTKFELAINLKSAKALGITISRSSLVLADEVIR